MGGGVINELVSFYFSAFPDHYKAKDFHELFGCIGEVVEISIAPRRNKFGKKFGFSRFIELEDASLLVVKLDNVIIDGNKIHTNLPRFERLRGKESIFYKRMDVFSHADVVAPKCSR